MRERGMVFNSEMVRAILDGRKTQTRRIMRVQPESNQFGLRRIIASAKRSDAGKYHWTESNATGNHIRSIPFSCPFGAVGDRLWVREAFRVHSRATDVATLAYRASERQSWTQQTRRVPIGECNKPVSPEAWSPSIHMPRWASRITLEITGVRVERLASISNDDARAEGYPAEREANGGTLDAWLWYRDLWDGIYPEQSFQHSPWVWVIEFKRVKVQQ